MWHFCCIMWAFFGHYGGYFPGMPSVVGNTPDDARDGDETDVSHICKNGCRVPGMGCPSCLSEDDRYWGRKGIFRFLWKCDLVLGALQQLSSRRSMTSCVTPRTLATDARNFSTSSSLIVIASGFAPVLSRRAGVPMQTSPIL